uniref:Uncharacterized protein n=1 Tax=Anopheles minimus TaxID=112268 RepID=A0A182WQ80_9DIPT
MNGHYFSFCWVTCYNGCDISTSWTFIEAFNNFQYDCRLPML